MVFGSIMKQLQQVYLFRIYCIKYGLDNFPKSDGIRCYTWNSTILLNLGEKEVKNTCLIVEKPLIVEINVFGHKKTSDIPKINLFLKKNIM